MLNNTSLKRVKEAWNRYDSDIMTLEQVETLHKSYTDSYSKAKLKYNNLDRYSSMKQTEIKTDIKLANRQEG